MAPEDRARSETPGKGQKCPDMALNNGRSCVRYTRENKMLGMVMGI